jgi:hypothetical protein
MVPLLAGKGFYFTFLFLTLTIVLSFQNCGKYKSSDNRNSSDNNTLGDHLAFKRLSNSEIDRSLRDFFGETTNPAFRLLPADAVAPYDNDVDSHTTSTPLVEGIERLAQDVSSRLLADQARRDSKLSCRGSSASDRSCMSRIVSQLSLQLFRRKEAPELISQWTDLALSQAASSGSFESGVDFALRFFLSHPKFIYRFENFTDARDLDFIIAERMAFLIWGSSPSASLLEEAEKNVLHTREQVQDKARTMLEDPRAVDRAKQFHAEWLAYEKLGHEASLSSSLKSEADSIVQKIVFTDKKPWEQIFEITESLMDDNVAAVYGLSQTGNTSWRTLPAGRRGILSTGAYLSAGAKFGDTSPTQRGKFVKNRLLCQEIPSPPPTTDVDQPPKPPENGPNCKKIRYQAHAATNTSCFSCHNHMDPIGFGLEQYDFSGRFRTFEKNGDGTDNTSCPIDGQGSLVGHGDFNGPVALSDLVSNSGRLQSCMAMQYFHFAFGFKSASKDAAFIELLARKITSQGTFQDFVLEFVGNSNFRLGAP